MFYMFLTRHYYNSASVCYYYASSLLLVYFLVSNKPLIRRPISFHYLILSLYVSIKLRSTRFLSISLFHLVADDFLSACSRARLCHLFCSIYINSCISDLEKMADEKATSDGVLYGLHLPSAVGNAYLTGTVLETLLATIG